MPSRKLVSKPGRVIHARRHFKRPSWLLRWHHLISVFVVFFGVGMIAASMQLNTEKFSIALAAVGGNMGGWIWADPIGWSSVTSTQVSACAGPGSCGSYGLNLDSVTKEINGFAWNDSAGWICFGSSCASVGSACASVPPTSDTGSAILKAWIDPITFPAPSNVAVHGWANICSLGSDGWVSLNCEEAPGSGGVGCPLLSYKYHAIFSTSPRVDGNQYFGAVTPPPDSYGWNGNVGGTGYGYFDFARTYFQPPVENTVPLCTDGLDNNLNGAIDCADPSCAVLPICLPEASCGAGAVACCTDGVDNNTNGVKDCADASCAALPICLGDAENPILRSPVHPLDNVCGDGVDNNGNALIDCADPICATYAGCIPSQAPGVTYNWTTSSTSGGPVTLTIPSCIDGVRNGTSVATDCGDPACATEPACLGPAPAGDVSSLTAGGSDQPLIDFLCSDGLDNGKLDGAIDCLDTSCQTKSTVCGSFIQAKFGNIYAQQGIVGAPSRPSRGSYCLNTTGAITDFSSDSGCASTGAGSIALPTQGTQYQGTLGSLDMNGILNGRYGTVIPIVSDAGIPAVLDGKVYYSSGNLTLNAKTFSNGGAQNSGHAVTERGNGLLVVTGTLTINGNIGYQTQSLPTSIRNLSSFGVIVKKDALGVGGDIRIAPGVTSISGAYFAENKIYTGTNSPAADSPLQVFGIMAAKQFSLQRVYPSSTVAAEQFIQDGRAVANPPPGMTELSKTLPVQKDAF